MTSLDAPGLERALGRLTRAVRLVRWPSAALAVGLGSGAGVLALLATTWRTTPRLVGLAISVVGAVVLAVFLYRRGRTLRAANAASLLADARTAVTMLGPESELLGRLRIALRGEGVSPLRRLVALWKVTAIPADALAGVVALPALGWFLPPRIGVSWAVAVLAFWSTIVLWVAIVAAAILSATPLL